MIRWDQVRGQVSGMKMGAWVSLVKSQLVEDEGKAGLKMKRERGSAGRQIDRGFVSEKVALTNDLSGQGIFRASGRQRQRV